MKTELGEEERLLMVAATKIANRRAQEELLADEGEFSLVSRLANVKKTTISTLRHNWKPFKVDHTTMADFGFRLTPQDDKLSMVIMRDMNLLDRMNEIATEAIVEAMDNRHRTFVPALLRDMFTDAPLHEVKTRRF